MVGLLVTLGREWWWLVLLHTSGWYGELPQATKAAISGVGSLLGWCLRQVSVPEYVPCLTH